MNKSKLYMSTCCKAETWQAFKSHSHCVRCGWDYYHNSFDLLPDGAKYTGYVLNGVWEIVYPNGDVCETTEWPVEKVHEPIVIDFKSVPIIAITVNGQKGILLSSQLDKLKQ